MGTSFDYPAYSAYRSYADEFLKTTISLTIKGWACLEAIQRPPKAAGLADQLQRKDENHYPPTLLVKPTSLSHHTDTAATAAENKVTTETEPRMVGIIDAR